MNHALFLNTLIVAAVLGIAVVMTQPMAILGLFFLRDMPYGLLQQPDEEADEQSNPIGFVHPDD